MSEGKGLVSALALYFVLLATVLAPLVGNWFDLEALATILVVDTVVVALWGAFHWRDLAGPLRTVGRGRDWLLVVAFVPVTLGVAQANAWLTTQVFALPSIDLIDLYRVGGYSLAGTLLVVAVQPAVVEEIACRGIIYRRLSVIVSPRTAVIITAVLFTALHVAFLSLVFLMCMGLLAGWLRWRSGSIYPGVALHFLHNALAVALTWIGWW